MFLRTVTIYFVLQLRFQVDEIGAVTAHPHQEIIRYEHKNVKWTLKHVHYYSDALACGLVDAGLQSGDVMLSWLPMHFAEQVSVYFNLLQPDNIDLQATLLFGDVGSLICERHFCGGLSLVSLICLHPALLFLHQHILQFACSKAGFLLYHLDPNPELAKSNPEAAKAALAKALELTKANVLFTQEAGDDVNYVHLTTGVIPEIRIFDFGEGMPFFTPRYPHLRFPVHTGYSIVDKEGMFAYKHFLLPSNNLDSLLRETGCKALDGKTPLLGELVLDKDGIPVSTGKVMTNEDVFKAKVWPEFTSILSREYKEIPGLGVVF